MTYQQQESGTGTVAFTIIAMFSFLLCVAQATNSLSLLMSLFGTSLCVRLLGLRWTLRIFPILLLVAVIASFFTPSLRVLFIAVAILKVHESKNQDSFCREAVYIPLQSLPSPDISDWVCRPRLGYIYD